MDFRCPRFLLLPAIAGLIVLSGCIGKSTSNPGSGGVRSVTLSPSTTLSLEFGRTQNFSATARNSSGASVFTTIHFSSDNNAALTVSNNGVACAGTWDSLSNPVRCSPGVEGIANITAEAEGVSSPPTKIYVHQHIQSIQVTPVGDPTDPCFSQGVTWDYQAKAYGANQADITNSVGPINWSSTTANVLTISTADLPNNQVKVTAKTPGITQIFASAAGTVSSPWNYTACLVKSVHLQVQGSSDNTIALNAGGAKTVVATAFDTLDVELTKPPITFSTSNPEIATVSTGGVVTARQNAGTADISASCTPPTCNIGVVPGLPIYSTGGTLPNGQPAFGVITAHVSQTKPPTATAWAATTDCAANFNCTSVMFPVATGTNPVGTAVGVPYTPNSLLFNPAGTRVFMGSDKGLMFVDVGAQNPAVSTVSQATTPCNVAICGKPLAISADGTRVVVSDTTTDPNQVYIFNAASPTNPPVDLLINGATAAAFSPDQMKIFILTNTGRLYVYSTVDALISVPLPGTTTGLAFSGDGSFAYLAGTPLENTISGLATCDAQPTVANGPTPPNFDFVTTPGAPVKIFASPDGEQVLAVDPPFIDIFSTSHTILPLPVNQFVCDGRNLVPAGVYIDPTVNFPQSVQSFNLGQGAFTPLFMQITGDGSRIIIVAQNIPAVLIFDVSAGNTTAIPLANNASPLAASATQDGTQVFVASCDADHVNPNTCGSIHVVNTQSGGDLQQAVYQNFNTNDSLCNNLPGPACLPNLIAVRPQ